MLMYVDVCCVLVSSFVPLVYHVTRAGLTGLLVRFCSSWKTWRSSSPKSNGWRHATCHAGVWHLIDCRVKKNQQILWYFFVSFVNVGSSQYVRESQHLEAFTYCEHVFPKRFWDMWHKKTPGMEITPAIVASGQESWEGGGRHSRFPVSAEGTDGETEKTQGHTDRTQRMQKTCHKTESDAVYRGIV